MKIHNEGQDHDSKILQTNCRINFLDKLKWKKEGYNLISRDCDGCSQLKSCKIRYEKVARGEKVYCPDGTVHLID